jgi:NUMOD4 motif/HNH endonuclease
MAMDDPTAERWLPVTGYEGLYEVSSLGRVRSLDRLVGGPQGPSSRIFPGRILKPHTQAPPRDYAQVRLSRENVQETHPVHRLVLEAFTGPCPAGMEALHGPGGKEDASIANLSWGTRAQNMGPDRVRDGQGNRGERSGLARLTWAQVCEIRERMARGESQVSIARFGVNNQTITLIKQRKTWAHPPEDW